MGTRRGKQTKEFVLGRCKAAYEEFGDIVTFDTTYLTNKYEMPMAPFVGVNHHGQSILFGCGLISNEDVRTFTWIFRTWLSCMSGRAPNAIITDQDQEMKNSIEIVFPGIRHRYMCLWHITKKIPEKLGKLKKYKLIKYKLKKNLYGSLTPSEFEAAWKTTLKQFVEQYENAMKDRVEKENIEDFNSYNS
ncbi:protein FAR1-RELATED SEQUENCE 8-like [Rutidosis leptorrhynchoides]|uniref:protein FAR1-RELATED SEQUENCE 8-like n=1 Tax=Rutidosis leptorrhynchoides TaxID=125765 RepID=UPI003A9967AC